MAFALIGSPRKSWVGLAERAARSLAMMMCAEAPLGSCGCAGSLRGLRIRSKAAFLLFMWRSGKGGPGKGVHGFKVRLLVEAACDVVADP